MNGTPQNGEDGTNPHVDFQVGGAVQRVEQQKILACGSTESECNSFSAFTWVLYQHFAPVDWRVPDSQKQQPNHHGGYAGVEMTPSSELVRIPPS